MTTAELAKIANLTAEAQALLQDDLSPSKYLAALSEKSLFKDAIQFLAHGMQVPTAIGWASACVKEFQAPDPKAKGKESLAVADRWLKSPDEKTRWEAKKAADDGEVSSAGDCVAMAVFLGGKSVAPPEVPDAPPPPYAAQKMAAGGILIAAVAHAPEKAPEKYRRALEMGKDMVKSSGAPKPA